MATAKPMIGDLELQQVQTIGADEKEVLAQHGVPALEGDFLQDLGRCAERITLNGVIIGAEAGEGLKKLREKFRGAEPVSFVADIATATKVDKVLIEEMGVRELAGKPSRFEYALALHEFIPPPTPKTEQPPPPPPPPEPPPLPSVDTGTLVVEVIVEGRSDFDFSTVRVTLEGTTEDGTPLTRTIESRSTNIWEEQLAPGQYTVRAIANPQGLAVAQIRAGQTASVTITLRTSAIVARQFLVHFRFDKAFVEPCMREVLRRAAARAASSTTEKLVIVGHADKAGPPDYNQSLSERRARAVHAFLTFGRDRSAALSEWKALRLTRPAGEKPSVKDNWGVREYQHILQDLGFYPGPVNGVENDLTRQAVREFRCQKGLSPGTATDDPFWDALIEAYMSQDSFAVAADRFLPNCPGEVLKWLGCGEEDPVKNIGTAHRPSRRVELLFVETNALPCQVPQPDTFNLPAPGAVNSGWCVGPPGPSTGGARGCFVTPVLVPGTNNPQPCSTSPTGPWCREPAEPGTITVQGSIMHEDGRPAANQAFVLITPIGEFLASEAGNGEPVPARTDSNGNFRFPDKRVGVYTLEVRRHDALVRLAEQSDAEVKGNAVCKVLNSDSDRLDAVIINAPLLREIRLTVVAHLMTALHPTTRTVRTCPSALGPPRRQATAHSATDVQSFIDAVNGIWRQGRIRFQLALEDIVSEAYAFRTDCEVDGNEFAFILEHCAYPSVVNLFFFGDLSGTAELGMHVLVSITSPRGTAEGCAITDRFQNAIITPPVDTDLTTDQTVQVVAHEFGHFLSLAPNNVHPTGARRLMLAAASLTGDNRTLVQTEVTQARASSNAGLECAPLSLSVTGATQIGSPRSHLHVVLQNTPGVVTIDAVISPALLDPAIGALNMTGGAPGANPQQRIVGTGATGPTEIVAIYTPAGGGQPSVTYATVHVVTFDRLRVEAGGRVLTPAGGTSNVFVVSRDATPNAVISIIAEVIPPPFCVPGNLVVWAGGNAVDDPLQRTVSRTAIAQTTVTATVAGTPRSVTIRVIELALTTNVAPFDIAVDPVQIEGVLNRELVPASGTFAQADLIGTQPNSLFRARADLPGIPVTINTVSATLLTNPPPPGAAIESRNITLTRTTGDRFVSPPILAIPSAVSRAEITTTGMEVIRAQAGGTLRFGVGGVFAGVGVAQARVRGRVLHLFAQALANAASGISSGITLPVLRRKIAHAARIWAQAGVEVKTRGAAAPVEVPVELLDVDHTDNTGTALTTEEQRLVGRIIRAGDPTRSAVASDLNIFYVRSLDPPPAPAADPSGIAYPNDPVIVIEGVDSSGNAVTTDEALAHEIGHQIIDWGGRDEHQDLTGAEWPATNVLHRSDTGGGEVDRTQIIDILTSTNAGTNSFVIFEP